MKILRKFKTLLLDRWKLKTHVAFGRSAFSQEGEDVLLWRLMDLDHSSGTYVDVGCNHPYRMSNTAFLYERGWSGIAIDPNPDFAELYAKLRPRDHFINCGIAEVNASLCYHKFEESLYNTFDAAKASNVAEDHSRLVAKVPVPVRPLSDVLKELWPAGKAITFLSVDCEGYDRQVLASHDYLNYPTSFICVEVNSLSVRDILTDPCVEFLEGKEYELVSKLGKSALLVHRSAASKWKLAL